MSTMWKRFAIVMLSSVLGVVAAGGCDPTDALLLPLALLTAGSWMSPAGTT